MLDCEISDACDDICEELIAQNAIHAPADESMSVFSLNCSLMAEEMNPILMEDDCVELSDY